jgi:Tol biopolymer transport system component
MRTNTWIALILSAALGLSLGAVQKEAQKDLRAEAQLQAAINKETVEGDLRGAIEQYRKIAALPDAGRATIATALLRMGQCYEKLGETDTQEARKAYERVVTQYADQTEQAQTAQAKLAALGGAPGRTAGTDMAVRRLLSGASVDTSGEPSPDGKYLSTSDASIFPAVRDIETGQTRRFTRKDNWSAVVQILTSRWSPDGKNIAFGLLTKDMSVEIWIVALNGSEPRMLAPGVPLDWSRDGNFILALTGKMPAPPLMALISVRDGSLNTLSAAANPVFSWSAILTPDGKSVVYDFPQQEKAQDRDIFLLSVDSKDVTPLVKHPADDRLLGWVPGTEIILFTSNRAGTQDAWALQVADGKPLGEPILVRQGLGQISPMGFTDKGSFYYGLGVSIVEVYEGSLDLAKGTVVEPARKIFQRVVGASHSPEWSPDGKSLAYVSERNTGSGSQGTYILCLRPDKATEERELPLAIQSFWHLHWSADSRAVFATAQDKENQGLFKIDIQTGKLTLVAQSGLGSIIKAFAVSPDGKAVFYGHFQSGKKLLTIVRHDLETGLEKEVYRQAAPPDITGLALSPDGKRLLFCTLNIPADQSYGGGPIPGHVIRILPATGGEIRDLLPGKIQGWVFPVWAQDGKTILFGGRISGPKETKQEIWQIPAEGGDPRKIASDKAGNINLHPDGRRIVFTSGNTLREIWVMENFLPPAKASK